MLSLMQKSYPITNGKNHIKVIKLFDAINPTSSFSLKCRKFCDSWDT